MRRPRSAWAGGSGRDARDQVARDDDQHEQQRRGERAGPRPRPRSPWVRRGQRSLGKDADLPQALARAVAVRRLAVARGREPEDTLAMAVSDERIMLRAVGP